MDATKSKQFNFLLKGSAEKAVLLIHGITGTPSEMRHFGKSLNKAGYTVFCNTLPRHCSTLNDLKKVTWQEIADCCTEDFKRLKNEYSKVFVGGLSMGALMSVHLASRFGDQVAGLLALAPTVFYDGWAIPKTKFLMDFLWHIPWVRNTMNIREDWPYGLKDEELREQIERFYKNARAEKFSNKVLLFGSPFFPMACLYQHHLFSQAVKKELNSVKNPILILHAREDDMSSLRNARFILDGIGSADKALVVLENSYHMITIDKDKDLVAQEAIAFLNAH